MKHAMLFVLFLNSTSIATALSFRVTDEFGGLDYLITPCQYQVIHPLRIEAVLDFDEEPTTDGIAEWTATLRITTFDPYAQFDICDTNSFFLGGVSLDNVNTAPFEIVSCDSVSGIMEVAGGPYHEGNIVLGVGNGSWTALAEGYLVVPPLLPCTSTMEVAITSLTASTIDPGQSGPPYATSPVNAESLYSQFYYVVGPGSICSPADMNCDGTVNAGDIGIVANAGNFGQEPPACDRTDVDESGGPVNAADIGILASGANFGSATGFVCCCFSQTPTACGIPWAQEGGCAALAAGTPRAGRVAVGEHAVAR
ncbi:MAG: hypothetical protein H6817_07670 [Phycisphaerales bacterium]|nr:hypothetical protein [Phycisphaerales bacterium]